jgi:hypothetical protein
MAQKSGFSVAKRQYAFTGIFGSFLAITSAAMALALCTGCAAPLAASGGSASATETAARGGAGGAVSGTVRNPSIFDITARSTKIAFLSPAALLSNNPSITGHIIGEQCRFDTPDPLFFVPDEDKQIGWTLAGRLDDKPYFQTAEYRSILTLGLKSGPLQVNTWPLQLASLADMPHLFLDQRLEAVGRAELNPSDQRELVQEYMQQEHRIQNVVMNLMNSYNRQGECRQGG